MMIRVILASLDLFHRQTLGNAIDLLKKTCGDYTFPKGILTDGGRQFVSWTGNNQFGTCLRNHQIKHTVWRTHHPQTNGKWNGSGGRCGRSFSTRGRLIAIRDSQLAGREKKKRMSCLSFRRSAMKKEEIAPFYSF